LTLDDGSAIDTPLLVVAIGQTPDVALAHACGLSLHTQNGGIRIDAQCRTVVPTIFAAGDCTSQHQPALGEEVRLESWQSANEQARIAAAAMLGVPADLAALPWFWTDQFGCNIQMLGMPVAGLTYHHRGNADAAAPKFLLLGLDGEGRMRHAIAVNAGGELRPLRGLIEGGVPCDPALLCNTSIPLKQLARDALAAAASPAFS
jgi:3-phenylpropionate/trans-cinnamate dioxygenase ferredoxin reductase component